MDMAILLSVLVGATHAGEISNISTGSYRLLYRISSELSSDVSILGLWKNLGECHGLQPTISVENLGEN